MKSINDVVTKDYALENPLGRANDARIVVPTEADLDRYTKASGRICGNCEHFNYRLGQQEYVGEQQVFQVAFQELEHDPNWYGRTDSFGGCEQWDGHMCSWATPITIPRHLLDSEVSYAEKDEMRECPYFRQAKTRGRWGRG